MRFREWIPVEGRCIAKALQKLPRIRLSLWRFNIVVLLIYSWNLQERRYVSLTFCWPNNYSVQNNLRCFQAVKRCLYETFELWKSWLWNSSSKKHISDLKNSLIEHKIEFVVIIIVNSLRNGRLLRSMF